MSKRKFKTESKRILELMINSIYTHKEIFLRELISNASDAIDKLFFRSLTDDTVGMSKSDFFIMVTPDKTARTLTISDNGCGMDENELEENLGTIARSGTLAFKENNELGEEFETIGQFGVGFYSAFMVSKKITVITRAFGSDKAYKWESSGVEGYTITETEKETVGTDIILYLKDNEEEEDYDTYLDTYHLSSLIKKYSDYIGYPIKMLQTTSRQKEGTQDEYEQVEELTTLNSMVPLWKRTKGELTDEDYNNFYKEKFYDYTDPRYTIHFNAEGTISYNALLFVPENPPYNFYTREFQRGLQLYSNGVMIMQNCEELLPDYFGFIKGLVDTPDVSLNISREILQHDRQLKAISRGIERKIRSELQRFLREDREKYNEFFKSFGRPLKFGAYEGFGANMENLKDLLLFESLNEKKLVTLAEYVSAMPEDQTFIYYACGENRERIERLPQLESLRERGYDVLCMTEDIDEFVVKILEKYQEKGFKSVASNDLVLGGEEEQKKLEKLNEDNKALLEAMKEALGDKVSAVTLSGKLKNNPVCLSASGELSLEMEKILNAMPNSTGVQAQRVLEINPEHAIFTTLVNLLETDKEKLALYAQLLYTQALIIEGMPVDDPVDYTNKICSIMA